MAEFDIRIPGKEQDTAWPEFFIEPRQNKAKTAKEGRPVFDDVEYVRIIMPGNRRDIPVERVNDQHRQRWPKQYEAFKGGQELSEGGTPLEQWSRVTRSQVEELRYFHIRTVEHLAKAPDQVLQNFMDGYRLREAAQLFMKDAEGLAPMTELAAQNEQLQSRVASLESQLQQAIARMESKRTADVAA